MTVCGIKHADGVCVMGECPYIKICCPVVWDKSKPPTTNEEYLKQASTEELAEALFTAYDDGLVRGEWNACGNGCCGGAGGKMLVKEDFEEWLKQPYKESKK